MSGRLSIEDYFLLQEIKYKSLEKAKFPLDEVINQNNATEIFT